MELDPLEPETRLHEMIGGRYRLTSFVAKGSAISIADAWDTIDERPVLIRLIRRRIMESPGFTHSFRTAMSSAALVSHPNLIAVFDWGVHDRADGTPSTAYVVTERLEGGSLRDILDRGRRLSYSQTLQLGLDLCHGLAEAHRNGHVHGEITPSKIVFGADGRARLADLGLAAPIQSALWSFGGGPENHMVLYTSPEVAEGKSSTSRSDVYGLGLVMVEALTGDVPFSTDSAAATLRARIGRLLPVTADLGPLAQVLEHAARPEVDERPTAVEFGLELVGVARRLPRPEPLALVLSFEPDPNELGQQKSTPGAETQLVPSVPPALNSADDASSGPNTVESLEVDDIVSKDAQADHPPRLSAMDSEDQPSVAAEQITATTQSDVQPASRPRWLVPVAAVIAVAVALLGARILLATPIYDVPALSGIAEAEAMNIVTPFEWQVKVTSERSDEYPVVGAVIRTSPASGEQLREGGLFTLVVSEGPVLRELPEVTAMQGADALDLLDNAGFQPFTEIVYNEVIDIGEVISWEIPDDPAIQAGDSVEPGTLVRLVLSGGPAPREVPNIVGLIVGVARAQLVGTGLRIVEVEEVYDDETETGLILSQSPQPGELLDRGGEIEVSVSLGPNLIAFPSVPRNSSFEDVQQLLTDAGFTVELVLGAADGNVEEITIDGETPSPGDEFPNGTQVDVVAA
ncbi:MAG: serine/threonine-protein kinase [Actinobacteria bacterium]|nr:serine/threonine-protein kinase [Actinomycetota bacterium]